MRLFGRIVGDMNTALGGEFEKGLASMTSLAEGGKKP
jgi:hypothetical protein